MAIAENQITLEIVADGQDGSGVSVDVDYNITGVIEEYAIGTESAATGEWSEEVPDVTSENPKLWYRQKVIWADESITYEPDTNGAIKKQIVDSGLNISDRVETIEETVDNKVDATTYDEDMVVRDTQINDINDDIGEINEQLLKELVAKGYAKITSAPSLELGRGASAWTVIITNQSIDLAKAGAVGATLSPNPERTDETLFRIDTTRLANLYFRSANGQGKLGIVAQSNGHISLKEI